MVPNIIYSQEADANSTEVKHIFVQSQMYVKIENERLELVEWEIV